MVVVVQVPDADCGRAFGFGRERAGVEQFLGEDPLVALGLAVVTRGVRAGALVSGGSADDPGEVVGEVAGAPLSVMTRWMWLIPWAASQTLARARNAAAVGPFSSASASV